MPRPETYRADFDPQTVFADVSVEPGRAIGPQIYEVLRSRIIDNRLPPGAVVSEAEVARLCDISRTPLRAAIQRLAAEGLVVVRPQVGTVVAPLDQARLEEAVFVRTAIECAVVRRLAERRADLSELSPTIERQRAAAARDDYMTFFRHDEAFHARLAEIADVPNAWGVIQSMKAHVDRQRLELMSSIKGRSATAFDQHLAVLSAIGAGDPDAAEKHMREHIHSVFI
ncbi:MAG: GntR family transcriptional regulator [Roseitalea porphyridii]|jgi:DNA-binding GntR family transcriptional regulator|uniref:GntR family transcriptional regulator n=1 Tax=Alphaproteobacteria TaxID=28211 RepID=UPI0032ECF1E3